MIIHITPCSVNAGRLFFVFHRAYPNEQGILKGLGVRLCAERIGAQRLFAFVFFLAQSSLLLQLLLFLFLLYL